MKCAANNEQKLTAEQVLTAPLVSLRPAALSVTQSLAWKKMHISVAGQWDKSVLAHEFKLKKELSENRPTVYEDRRLFLPSRQVQASGSVTF